MLDIAYNKSRSRLHESQRKEDVGSGGAEPFTPTVYLSVLRHPLRAPS